MHFFFNTHEKFKLSAKRVGVLTLTTFSVPAALLTQTVINHQASNAFLMTFLNSSSLSGVVNSILAFGGLLGGVLLGCFFIALCKDWYEIWKKKESDPYPRAPSKTADKLRVSTNLNGLHWTICGTCLFLVTAQGKFLHDSLQGVRTTQAFDSAMNDVSNRLIFAVAVVIFFAIICMRKNLSKNWVGDELDELAFNDEGADSANRANQGLISNTKT